MSKGYWKAMYCYKLTIAYDGTAYSGWQVQPNARTIQEELHKVLRVLLHNPDIYVIGSGRTDAGVHALAQVAHFRYDYELNLGLILKSLNGMLPKDIRIKSIEKAVDPNFHAQYDAIGKEYHYHLYLDQVMDPFRRFYCWHVKRKVDLGRLTQAASYFVGTHDFTSFANEGHAGSASRDPVRTIRRLDVVPISGGVCLQFQGDGFLYKMVRNIVGMLVEVASSRMELEEIPLIFEAKDRRKAPRAAPPQGLFLVRVDYPIENYF